MIKDIINFVMSLLLLNFVLSLAPKTTAIPITVTKEPSPPVLPTIPAGIFTQQLQQPNYDFEMDVAYDDEDDWYLPFRSDTHDHFSWDLLKDVLQKELTRNIIVSPFSVKVVLALLTEATGNGSLTSKELKHALADEIGSESENLREYYKKILPLLKRTNPFYTLNLETKLYADAFVEPLPKYTAKLHEYYDTKLERLNFADAHASAEAINAWASNVTAGMLQGLVTEANIPNNVLLMANVIYFKSLWRRQFNESYAGVFYRTPSERVTVEYMEQTDQFYHYDARSLDAQILRLPYKGGKFAMFVVLPNLKWSVDELTAALENNQYKNMQWRMDRKKVKVIMPKFQFDFKLNLKETLGRLGIRDIFENSASLPGLASGVHVDGRLKVSNIFQKAGIEVNEFGTEAYGSTVVEIVNRFGGAAQIKEFNVNRPFIFFIEEETTGTIIFAGKVLEPYV